jgi:hypothetical protein
MEHGPEDVSMSRQVEVVGFQLANYHPDLVLVQKQSPENRSLGVDVVGREPKRGGRPELRPGAHAATTRI